jgi:hypothetical protein
MMVISKKILGLKPPETRFYGSLKIKEKFAMIAIFTCRGFYSFPIFRGEAPLEIASVSKLGRK